MDSTLPPFTIPDDISLNPSIIPLGGVGSHERVGAGFMEKECGVDHRDYDPLYYSLCYVISGEGVYELGGRRMELTPGTIFQRMPGYPHTTRVTYSPPWAECFIDFGPHLFQSLTHLGLIDPTRPCANIGLSQEWVDRFAQQCRLVQNRGTQHPYEVLVSNFQLAVRILTVASLPSKETDQAMILEARDLLSRNLDQRIDLREICDQRGWDYDTFRRMFKRSTGVSPVQYHIRRRIDEACQLMKIHPGEKLQFFSDRLGYPSVYEFSAQFKQHIGITPGQYKKLHVQH
jgi:AraC family transcriptional regulator of arabinose operon